MTRKRVILLEWSSIFASTTCNPYSSFAKLLATAARFGSVAANWAAWAVLAAASTRNTPTPPPPLAALWEDARYASERNKRRRRAEFLTRRHVREGRLGTEISDPNGSFQGARGRKYLAVDGVDSLSWKRPPIQFGKPSEDLLFTAGNVNFFFPPLLLMPDLLGKRGPFVQKREDFFLNLIELRSERVGRLFTA